MKKLSLFVFFFLVSHLHAIEEARETTFREFNDLMAAEHSIVRVISKAEATPEEWANYFAESPAVVDRYISSGMHMKEIVSHILEGGTGETRDPKGAAYYCVGDYIWRFSWNLAYYDPVLSEGKKREAAQAVISALRAMPVGGSENLVGTQSYPLISLGFYYLFSPWRHRPEVIEYVKTVEFTDHISFNRSRVDKLVRLHEGKVVDLDYMPIPRPEPGQVFPVHPAARARAEASAQAEQERKNASPAPNPAPAPAPPPPPAVSAPAPPRRPRNLPMPCGGSLAPSPRSAPQPPRCVERNPSPNGSLVSAKRRMDMVDPRLVPDRRTSGSQELAVEDGEPQPRGSGTKLRLLVLGLEVAEPRFPSS